MRVVDDRAKCAAQAHDGLLALFGFGRRRGKTPVRRSDTKRAPHSLGKLLAGLFDEAQRHRYPAI